MRPPDVGDDRCVGLGDFGEQGNFFLRIGPHFNDGDVGFCARSEQGQRHADVVVEVANGGVNVGVSGLQHAFHQFLGRGLAIASRQAITGQDHFRRCQRARDCKLPAHRHQNETRITRRGVLAFIYDSSDAAGINGLLCVGVPIEILTFQSEKQLASSGCACVRSDTRGRIKVRLNGLELGIGVG